MLTIPFEYSFFVFEFIYVQNNVGLKAFGDSFFSINTVFLNIMHVSFNMVLSSF